MLPTGEIEVLATSLIDKKKHPRSDFKSLYNMRWGVETFYSRIKNNLSLENFSGRTAEAVKQDFYATVFTTNLYFLLIKDAQETLDENNTGKKYPMQVNNNRASGKMKELLVPLFLEQEPIKILMKLHDYFIRSPLPVRKNRSFPRVIKNPQSKSKHKTFSNYKPAY